MLEDSQKTVSVLTYPSAEFGRERERERGGTPRSGGQGAAESLVPYGPEGTVVRRSSNQLHQRPCYCQPPRSTRLIGVTWMITIRRLLVCRPQPCLFTRGISKSAVAGLGFHQFVEVLHGSRVTGLGFIARRPPRMPVRVELTPHVSQRDPFPLFQERAPGVGGHTR